MAFTPSFKMTQIVGPLAGKSNQGIHEISGVQNYPLGTVVEANDRVLGKAKFVYCVGVASTVIGDPIQINADFTTARAVGGTAKGHIGVAMSACVANKYGWYCIKGRVPVKIAADVSAVARASIVSAVWSDATTATKQIDGASLDVALDAGGSAIPGTTETTAAHFAIATIAYPQATVLV